MITFRQLDHTKALDQKIREKASKLLKHLSPSAIIQWTCSTDGHHHHKSKVMINDGGKNYYVHAENSNLYKTFDDAIKKLKQQFSHTRRYALINK